MSAENLPDVPEWHRWAQPGCPRCGGLGRVETSNPVYNGWKWCHCSIANLKRRIETDDGSSGQHRGEGKRE